MKKVFLGGSRRLSKLNSQITQRLDNIISNEFDVIVGDANGADKAFQKFFSQKNYPNVTIYCAGIQCRNNIGEWEEVHVNTERATKDFKHYAIRDKKMSEDSNYGFMIWNGKSRGTRTNVLNLTEQLKTVLLFYSPWKKFFVFKNQSDFEEFLSSISQDDKTSVQSTEIDLFNFA